MKGLVLIALAALLLTAACAAPAAPASPTHTPIPIPTLGPTEAPAAPPRAGPTTASTSSAGSSANNPSQAPTTAAPISPSTNSGGQVFTVMVGGEDTTVGATLNAFFPSVVHVHVGQTILWKQNSHEPHTVTFLPDVNNVPEL